LEVPNTVSYYGVDSYPLGTSFAEWTAKWWKWVYSIPKTNNPITDPTGELCSTNQHGQVWFLGGKPADEQPDLPFRRCCIPSNVSVLFPVINCEANRIEYPMLSDNELVENVVEHMKLITKRECYVNGVPVPIQRVQSKPIVFDLEITRDNVFGLEAGFTIASADGYWVFLKPLMRGNYHVSFSGACSAGKRKSGADYQLKVI